MTGEWAVVHVDLAAGLAGEPPRHRAGGAVVARPARSARSARRRWPTAQADASGQGWRWRWREAIAPAVAARLAPGAVAQLAARPCGVTPAATARSRRWRRATCSAALDGLAVTGVRKDDADDLTVVVCTRDRPDDLARTLAALAAQAAAARARSWWSTTLRRGDAHPAVVRRRPRSATSPSPGPA